MTHRLTTNCAKSYCNRTLICKVIVENVVTCFLGDTVYVVSQSIRRGLCVVCREAGTGRGCTLPTNFERVHINTKPNFGAMTLSYEVLV